MKELVDRREQLFESKARKAIQYKVDNYGKPSHT